MSSVILLTLGEQSSHSDGDQGFQRQSGSVNLAVPQKPLSAGGVKPLTLEAGLPTFLLLPSPCFKMWLYYHSALVRWTDEERTAVGKTVCH